MPLQKANLYSSFSSADNVFLVAELNQIIRFSLLERGRERDQALTPNGIFISLESKEGCHQWLSSMENVGVSPFF